MESAPAWKILTAKTTEHFEQARYLFQAYADWLQVDLSYQHFEQELTLIPQMYGPPHGKLLLAYVNDTAVGCVGVRPFKTTTCEMKRLYVNSDFQGLGIGRALAKQIIQEACTLGYESMVLDTLKRMQSARKLYQSLGFEKTSPYYENPLPEVIYLKMVLLCNNN